MNPRLKDCLFIGLSAVWLWRTWMIFHLPLEWGMMDDAKWIQQFSAPGFDWSFIHFLKSFLKVDLRWGLFRPTYGLWSYLIYGVGTVRVGLGPNAAYLITWFLTTATAALFSACFARSLPRGTRTAISNQEEERKKRNSSFFVFFLSLI